MNDLIDRLEQEIRKEILAAMPADASGALPGMRLADLLISYGTWRSRLVPARPRKAHISNELATGTKRNEHQVALDALVAKIEAGQDLTPHLSRRIKVAHDPDTRRQSSRKDRDLLIADWGVHHLHLSTDIESDGFVERSGDLLFATFTEDDAYLINIYPHGSWALKDVVTTLARNWPKSGILRPVSGLAPVSPEPTEAERAQLRNAGVAQLLEIDGKLYFPPGQTTAGTPIAATMRANTVIWALQDWRKDGKGRLAEASRKIDASAGRLVSPEWRPVADEHICGLAREQYLVLVAELY